MKIRTFEYHTADRLSGQTIGRYIRVEMGIYVIEGYLHAVNHEPGNIVTIRFQGIAADFTLRPDQNVGIAQ